MAAVSSSTRQVMIFIFIVCLFLFTYIYVLDSSEKFTNNWNNFPLINSSKSSQHPKDTEYQYQVLQVLNNFIADLLQNSTVVDTTSAHPYKREHPFIPNNRNEVELHEPADIPTEFLIEEADFCDRNKDLKVVGYVYSSLSSIEKRKAARETWVTRGRSVGVGVVFMVGRTKNEAEEKILKEENEKHHDIIQGNYTDIYDLLTFKGLNAMKWITKNCYHVPWALKVDDDAFVDPFRLTEKVEELSKTIDNKCYCSFDPVQKTGRDGKWLVSTKEFPLDKYLPYCKGAFYLCPTVVTLKLLYASLSVPFLWLEDVYLTGLLAQAAGVGHYVDADISLNNQGSVGTRVMWWVQDPQQIRNLWSMVDSRHPLTTTTDSPSNLTANSTK